MSLKKKIYKQLPFIPKFNLEMGRKLHYWKVKKNRNTVREAVKQMSSIYTNVGSGGVGLPQGWINIDYGRYENVHYTYDCRKELPFASNSVKGLFTEHFFEHLAFEDEVPEFLKDAYRVLEKGGCMRIIIPDAEKYLFAYCSEGWEQLKVTRPLDDDLNDLLMGKRYNTKMELINEVFRQGGQHKYAWDYDTLKFVLQQAGFVNISKRSYMDSQDPYLAIDMEARRHESLYVEAVK